MTLNVNVNDTSSLVFDRVLTFREVNEIVEEQRSWLVNKLITGTLTAGEWGEEVKKLNGWKDLQQP